MWAAERAGRLDLAHRLRGELRARRVAADNDHQDRVLVLWPARDIHEAADCARRERDAVERLEIHMLELPLLVLPDRAPRAGHRDEGLVGVVVVQHRSLAGLRAAVAEVEPLRDLDRRHARGLETERGLLAAALDLRRLEADHVVEDALAARHAAVGQPAVAAFQLLEARDALHHVPARYAPARQSLVADHGRLLPMPFSIV